MAIGTITIGSTVNLGNGARLYKTSFAGDADYVTGGTVAADVTAALILAIKTAELLATDTNVRGSMTPTVVDVIGGDCGQYEAYWSATGLKVLDGGHATRAEIAAHADVHLVTFNVTFITK